MNNTVGKNKIDILCVGSSHVYCGINPIQLYSEYGFAAYDLAEGSQAPWQSYCYIKEACKKQSPQIIIYDVYMMGTKQDIYNQYYDYQTVSNLLHLRFSKNKVDALLESKANNILDILLVFPYTYDEYDKYTGITTNKWYGTPDYSLGYIYKTGVYEYNSIEDIQDVFESNDIHPKNEEYLKKIIEYCSENDINLLLTNTPWPCINDEYQRYFNYIGEIAKEYNVPFINGCLYYEDMGIDYRTDSYGDGGHLNYNGVSKYTTYIGNYMDENYELIDHRGENGYDAYENSIRWLEEKILESEKKE